MNADKWIKALYEANYRTLYRVVCNLLYAGVGHTEDAQDIIQEVFLLAAWKEIYSHPKPEAWLIQTAKNLSMNYLRANRRKNHAYNHAAKLSLVKHPRRSQGYLEPSVNDHGASEIHLSLQQELSPEEWELVQRYCIENQSVEEIAASLGLSPNAVYARIFRIRKKIKNFLPEA